MTCLGTLVVAACVTWPALILYGTLSLPIKDDPNSWGKTCLIADEYFMTVWPLVFYSVFTAVFVSVVIAITVLYSKLALEMVRLKKIQMSRIGSATTSKVTASHDELSKGIKVASKATLGSTGASKVTVESKETTKVTDGTAQTTKTTVMTAESTATTKTTGETTATTKTTGESTATTKMTGVTTATSKMTGETTATSKMTGETTAISKMIGESTDVAYDDHDKEGQLERTASLPYLLLNQSRENNVVPGQIADTGSQPNPAQAGGRSKLTEEDSDLATRTDGPDRRVSFQQVPAGNTTQAVPDDGATAVAPLPAILEIEAPDSVKESRATSAKDKVVESPKLGKAEPSTFNSEADPSSVMNVNQPGREQSHNCCVELIARCLVGKTDTTTYNPSKTTTVLFSVTFICFISYFPFFVIVLLRSWRGPMFFMGLTDIDIIAINLFIRFTYISNVANPFIYGAMNKQFRGELLRLIGFKGDLGSIT